MITGVISIIIGLVILFFIQNSTSFIYNKMLGLASEILPSIYLIIQVVIIMPILEEFIYRFYKIKSNYLVLNAILLIIIVWLLNKNIIILISLLLFAILLFYHKKNNKIFFKLMIYFSSICFAISHLQNFTSQSIYSYSSPFLILFGLGLIFMAIRVKFGILYSIITHIVYNLFLIYFSFLNSESEIKFNNESYFIELEKENFLSNKMGSSTLLSEDTLLINNTPINKIIEQKTPINTNTFYHIEPSIFKYSGKILIKESNFNSLLNLFKYKMDSTIEIKEGISLSITNDIQDISSSFDSTQIFKRRLVGFSLSGILKTISNELKTPIEIKNVKPKILNQKINVTYFSNLTFEQNIKLINKKHNLKLKITPKKITYITYYIKKAHNKMYK